MSTAGSGATRMTDGPIWKRMIVFAIPILLGNLFQQLYNVADSLIVGNFLGRESLAAVSSSGALIFLMIGFFNGMSVGCGVVIARYFGAKQTDRLRVTIHTTVAVGIIAGIFLTVIGVILTPVILHLMNTPEEIIDQSVIYFRVYYLGSLAFVLYNFLVGILQAVGDSRHPLYYLMISSILNVVLDLILVGVFHFGVWAAAFATIISQTVSAVLCILQLCRTKGEYRLVFSEIRIDRSVLKEIIENGIPTGFQNSIISVANVVVQSSINGFGHIAVAGCGSYSKIEGFVLLPVTCVSLAISTFISQNIGAGEYERARKGAHFGIFCAMTSAELVGIIFFLSAPYLISIFSSDPEVIAFGVRQARTEALFYMFLGLSHGMAGIFRGAGHAMWPMIVMLCCWCIFRVSYIVTGLHFFNRIEWVFSAYPVTWSLSSIVFTVLFLRGKWLKES